jgi:hypothetical protein
LAVETIKGEPLHPDGLVGEAWPIAKERASSTARPSRRVILGR